MHIYGIWKNTTNEPVQARIEPQMKRRGQDTAEEGEWWDTLKE